MPPTMRMLPHSHQTTQPSRVNKLQQELHWLPRHFHLRSPLILLIATAVLLLSCNENSRAEVAASPTSPSAAKASAPAAANTNPAGAAKNDAAAGKTPPKFTYNFNKA